ncbi:uncharacterized protein LOC114526773 [Dendronephthya gigantea]|uniref:uncharacterized protein LOC114526773 n=1 Tax=Dendronephthya gigantea TaxID=151771 RepID=UPI00106CAC9B|nr:uncharacterized protein LOC114526773 [Dendronephthya gigantea]
MLGQVTFGWIDKRCKQATGSYDKVFGGNSLILTGDPGQLPPVADKPLYHAKPSSAVGEQGFQAYQMFEKVVKLTVNQRVQGVTSEQIIFRELLLRLRKGESTIDDWKLLLTRQPSKVTNIKEFEDATRLFYSNEQVANYNHEQLSKLSHPIARVNARHSSEMAKKISSDDMSGLEPVVFLTKGARVMLTMNLWSSVGLCNGATGIVVDIIYHNNHQPPDLPIAVIIEFENYRGPAFNVDKPSCIPICPITVSSQSETGFHERQQLPLRLAWALTIHKSQGLTLARAWINIGKSERTAGVSYVAISRVKSLSSCVIEPMTFSCYLHAVSPVKVSASGTCKYFNMTLQTSDGSMNAVCFSPEKRSVLQKFQTEKSPVKITTFRTSSKYGKEDVVIDKATKITPVEKNIGFEHRDLAPSFVTSLASLNQVSAEQLVTVKAKVAKVSGSKKISSQRISSGHLKKQEIVIADPTTSMKLILWEQFIDCLEADQTYMLKNLRLKQNGTTKYLNTPKSDTFSFEKVEEFTEPVIEDVQTLSTIDVCVSLLGVESISAYHACRKCGKKTSSKNEGVLQCETCRMVKKSGSASKLWFLRLLFKNVKKPSDTISLSIFNDNLTRIVDYLPEEVDLTTISPEQLSIALLSMPQVQITYDIVTRKVIDVKEINI